MLGGVSIWVRSTVVFLMKERGTTHNMGQGSHCRKVMENEKWSGKVMENTQMGRNHGKVMEFNISQRPDFFGRFLKKSYRPTLFSLTYCQVEIYYYC